MYNKTMTLKRLAEYARENDAETLRSKLDRMDVTNVALVEPLRIAGEAEYDDILTTLLDAINTDVLNAHSILSGELQSILPRMANTCPERVVELASEFHDETFLANVSLALIRGGHPDSFQQLVEGLRTRTAKRVSKSVLKKEPTVETLDAVEEARVDWDGPGELFKALTHKKSLRQKPVELIEAIIDRHGVPSTSGSLVARALRYGATEVADTVLGQFENAQSIGGDNTDQVKEAIKAGDIDARMVSDILQVLYRHDLRITDEAFVKFALKTLSDHNHADETARELLDYYRDEDGPRSTNGRQIKALIQTGYELQTIQAYIDRLESSTYFSIDKIAEAVFSYEQPRELFKCLIDDDNVQDMVVNALFGHPDAPWSNQRTDFMNSLQPEHHQRLFKHNLEANDPTGGSLKELLESQHFDNDQFDDTTILGWLFDGHRTDGSDEDLAQALTMLEEYGVDIAKLPDVAENSPRFTANYSSTLQLLQDRCETPRYHKLEFSLRLKRGDSEDAEFLHDYLNSDRPLPENVNMLEAIKIDPDLGAKLIRRGRELTSLSFKKALIHGGDLLQAVRDEGPPDAKKRVTALRRLIRLSKNDEQGENRAIARLFTFDLPLNDPPTTYGATHDKQDEPIVVELAELATRKDNWRPYCELMREALRQGADPNAGNGRAMALALDDKNRQLFDILFEHGFNPRTDEAQQIFTGLLEHCVEQGEADRFELSALRTYLKHGGVLPADTINSLPPNSEIKEQLQSHLSRRQQQYSDVREAASE